MKTSLRYLLLTLISALTVMVNADDADDTRKKTKILEARRAPLKKWEVWPRSELRPFIGFGNLAYGLSHRWYGKGLPKNDLYPNVMERQEHPPWVRIVARRAEKICDAAAKNDEKTFRALCGKGKDVDVKTLFEKMRLSCMYWNVAVLAVARDRAEPNRIAVEIQHGDLERVRDTRGELDDHMTFKEYLEFHGKDDAFRKENIGRGFRKLLFFVHDEETKTWLLDPKGRDKSLNDLFKKEIFYCRLRMGSVWDEWKTEKDKVYIDDFSKPFDYKRYYRPNAHFTLEEATKLENLARVMLKPRQILSLKERYLAGIKPRSFNGFVQGMNWKNTYSRKQMEKFLKQVNKINKQDLRLNILYGKDRLRYLMEKHDWRLFKRPVSMTVYLDNVDLLITNESRLLDQVFRNASRKYYYTKSVKEYKAKIAKYGEYGKGGIEKHGLSALQIHGYKAVKFGKLNMVFFSGLFVAPKNPSDSKQYQFLIGNIASKARGEWKHDRFLLDIKIAERRYSSRIGYSTLLNSNFDKIDKLPLYLDHKVTGEQYHDRLKKLKIYDIFRLRKPEECTVYKRGLDHTKLPIWTLEEIEKAK